jgi:hypothetical protein
VAAAQGAAGDGELMTSYYRPEITGLPEMGVVAKLWTESDPGDIQTAFLATTSRRSCSCSSRSSASAAAGEAGTSRPSRNCRSGGFLTNKGAPGEAAPDERHRRS